MSRRIFTSSPRQIVGMALAAVSIHCSSAAQAAVVDFVILKGHPCNVWMSQSGSGAADNFAHFRVKNALGVFEDKTISGASSNYLSSLFAAPYFNTLITNLPVIQPVDFDLASSVLGATFGVDVCVPALDTSRTDLANWTVTISRDGPLAAPTGDWFQIAQPTVSLSMIANNCESTTYPAALSTSAPSGTNPCKVIPPSPAQSNVLVSLTPPLTYNFDLLANRDAVLRITLQEQFTGTSRPFQLHAGDINVVFTANLPPLVLGDLLEKQLFWAGDPYYSVEGNLPCTTADVENILAFDKLNLQGAQNSLELNWTGDDNDCSKTIPCGNNRDKSNFKSPLTVLQPNGTPATNPSDLVATFFGIYNDAAQSNEGGSSIAYPADGRIDFNYTVDKVYRDSGSIFFSTTLSRQISSTTLKKCRVWFKRSQSFDCDSLLALQLPSPEPAQLHDICTNMRENTRPPPANP